MSKLAHSGKQQLILLIRLTMILLIILGLIVSLIYNRGGNTVIKVNLGILCLLSVIDILAIVGYRLKMPYILLATYLLETPSILTLLVIGIISIIKSSHEENNTTLFVTNGII